jgi:hypothetical protein
MPMRPAMAVTQFASDVDRKTSRPIFPGHVPEFPESRANIASTPRHDNAGLVVVTNLATTDKAAPLP